MFFCFFFYTSLGGLREVRWTFHCRVLCPTYPIQNRLLWGDRACRHQHLSNPSLTTKQPMKIRREIAEVLQSNSNRCTTKWKDLGGSFVKREREREKTWLKQRQYTFCTLRSNLNDCGTVNQVSVWLLHSWQTKPPATANCINCQRCSLLC